MHTGNIVESEFTAHTEREKGVKNGSLVSTLGGQAERFYTQRLGKIRKARAEKELTAR